MTTELEAAAKQQAFLYAPLVTQLADKLYLDARSGKVT